MSDDHIVVASTNPDGTYSAYVEDDGRVIYLYLSSLIDAGPPLTSVWVANRVAAPDAVDRAAMAAGTVPLNPAAYCNHPSGVGPFDPGLVELVWLPEGDGVALFEGDDLVAAIVPWAADTDFPGYARDAIGIGPLACALDEADPVQQLFDEARMYWSAWDASRTPSLVLQEAELRAYAEVFGLHQNFFGIDPADVWPPIGVARYHEFGVTLLTTVGVAVRPMPALWRYCADPSPYRRIELGVGVESTSDEAAIRAVTGYLGAQGRLPWAKNTFLGHGHTLPADVFAAIGYPAVILTAAGQGVPSLPIPDYRDDPVTMLWMTPITDDERQLAVEYGVDHLLEQIELPRIVRVG